MLIETAIMTHLLAQSFVTTYLTSSNDTKRIYFVTAPQEIAKPYVVITKVDSPEVASQDGPAGLQYPRFQLSVFATTYKVAKEISAAIKTALDGFSGIMGGAGGLQVDITQREDENDFYEEATKLHHVASDYIIWHQE